jgi:hypothetical protein
MENGYEFVWAVVYSPIFLKIILREGGIILKQTIAKFKEI